MQHTFAKSHFLTNPVTAGKVHLAETPASWPEILKN